MINNAGVMLLGPIVDAPVEEWERMVALNLKGLLYFAHAALPAPAGAPPRQEPRRVADLVNVSSVAGRRGAGGGVYKLTKHGVGAFSEALRQEVTGRHVRVSLVEPGAAAHRARHAMREEVRDQLQRLADASAWRPTTSPTRSSTSSPGPAAWRSTRSSSARPSRSARGLPSAERAVGVALVVGDLNARPCGCGRTRDAAASSANSTSAVQRPVERALVVVDLGGQAAVRGTKKRVLTTWRPSVSGHSRSKRSRVDVELLLGANEADPRLTVSRSSRSCGARAPRRRPDRLRVALLQPPRGVALEAVRRRGEHELALDPPCSRARVIAGALRPQPRSPMPPGRAPRAPPS